PMRDASETSVLKVLALSEGLMPFASKDAYIYRREGAAGGRNEIPIEIGKIMARRSPDVPLLANDILYIPDSKSRRGFAAAMERVLGLSGTFGTAAIYVTH